MKEEIEDKSFEERIMERGKKGGVLRKEEEERMIKRMKI